MAEHDLIIRGGAVVDGTGAPARTADVAITDGVVTEVGRVEGRAAQELDADGLLVTPGFVDIHVHYDGQATWDHRLIPSSWHGVTTVVAGNCGVGFAPVRPADHQRLIELMEGVEDIPGAALHEGLPWTWESFPEFLDALDDRPYDVDLATQVPHGALRLHVMGERGAAREPATPADIEAMAALAAEGVRAGGLGFSTSRTRNHRSSNGELTPSLDAEADELLGIARAIGATGAGVLQVVSDFDDVDAEFGLFRSMAETAGRPLSFSLAGVDPAKYPRQLALLEQANADGVRMRGQAAARAIGILVGLQCTVNPLAGNPVWAEIAGLTVAEQARAMAEPSFKERFLAAAERPLGGADRMFELADPPDYEPDPSTSIEARAAREGRTPLDLAYDLFAHDEGRTLLYVPIINWFDGTLDGVGEMLAHEHTVPGLSDGGAHVGTICDASFPTTFLSHWGRDRGRGRLDLGYLVRQHTKDTAETVGLLDRGVLAPGYRADVNLIDFDALRVRRPEMAHDLPAGGKRLLQRADGYVATLVRGQVTYQGGEPTDALPGRLLRGARPAPAGVGG
jgi:N-acyl-D-aspartate/D-glutamate deacylase